MSGIGLGVGIAEWFAKRTLLTKGASIVKAIPKPVWEALTVIAYVLALIFLHQHYANAAIDRAYKKGYATATAEIQAEESKKTAEVVAITNEGDGQSDQVNRGVQQTYAKESDSINAAADRLRRSINSQRRAVSVPGANLPKVSYGAVGPTETLSGGRSADDRLGAGDPRQAGPEPTLVVPALQLVDRAVICDTDHAQVKSWWAWYNANEKIYLDWVAKVKKVAQPEKMKVETKPSS